MKKLFLFIILSLILCFNVYALTTTTTGAGDWNTAGNWDNGIPTVADNAVVNHNMDITATGATFANLDNNATITFSGTAEVIIAGGGDIDNNAGVINASNQNVTFKSSNTTKWTWDVDSGTWTDGSGEHHFENGRITIANTYTGFNSGSYYFDDDMQFDASASIKTFAVNAVATFAANKTYTLGDGTNATFQFRIGGGISAVGGSGTEITFDGNNKTGSFYLYDNAGIGTFTIQYCNFTDSYYGLFIQDISGGTITLENCNSYSNTYGVYISIIDAGQTLTFSGWDIYSNSLDGVYSNFFTATFCLFQDCNTYSNTASGINVNQTNVQTIKLNRTKSYSNGSYGLFSTCKGIEILASLFYENTFNGAYVRFTEAATADDIINSTFADNGSIYANFLTDLDAGDSLNIVNCIFSGATYGLRSTSGVGDPDPTVTYCDAFGGSVSNYDGMADPTGSNGNISADPRFKDAATDNYDVKGSSPCCNAGTNVGAAATDINADAWANTNVEMGCYTELQTFGPQIIVVESP